MNGDVTDQRLRLADLVVVMMVIAGLAALILPAWGRFLESEGMVRCQSNLKRIYLALDTYVQDNGGMLPRAICDSGASGSNWYQVLATEGYVKDKGVFVCPRDPSPETFNTGPPMTGRRKTPYRGIHPDCYYYEPGTGTYRRGDGRPHEDELFPDGGSYGMNRELGGHRYGEVMSLSKTPFLMDSVHPSFEDGTQVSAPPGAPTIMPRDGPFGGPHNARWHGGECVPYVKEDVDVDADARSEKRLQGGNNVLFLDGHVEFLGGSMVGNRARKCDTDVTKRADGEPFETDPTAPDCGEEVD